MWYWFFQSNENWKLSKCWCLFRWSGMKPLGNRTKHYLVPGSSLSRRKLNFCLSGPMRPVQFRFCENMIIIIFIVVRHFHWHDPAQLFWWCYSPSFACLVFSTCSPHMWVVLGSSYPGRKIPWINNTDTVQRWSIFLLWLMCKLRAILIEKNKYVYRCFF